MSNEENTWNDNNGTSNYGAFCNDVSYRVAVDGGLERNQIFNMMKRGSMPEIPVLDKICQGVRCNIKRIF